MRQGTGPTMRGQHSALVLVLVLALCAPSCGGPDTVVDGGPDRLPDAGTSDSSINFEPDMTVPEDSAVPEDAGPDLAVQEDAGPDLAVPVDAGPDLAVPVEFVVADAYAVTGNIRISVPAPGVLANDTLNGGTLTHFGPTPATATPAPGTITTSLGGSVLLSADGSFKYNPPAGFNGVDTFYYRLTQGSDTFTSQVTLTVTNHVWFVRIGAPAGDGRLTAPSNDLAATLAAAGPGHRIFLYKQPTRYTGDVNVQAGQRLIGQGVALDASSLGFEPAPNSDPLPAATTHTVIEGTMTYGGDNAGLFGLNIQPPAGEGVTDGGVARTGLLAVSVRVYADGDAAVSLDGSSGDFVFRDLHTDDALHGIFLRNVGGSFTVTGDGMTTESGGLISASTGNGVQLTNNTAAITLRYMTFLNAIPSADTETTGNSVMIDGSTAVGSVELDHCAFTTNAARGLYVHPTGTGSTALKVTNTVFLAGIGTGTDIRLFYHGATHSNSFTIADNRFTSSIDTAIQIDMGTSASLMQTVRGRIRNNQMTSTRTGVSINVNDNADSTLVVAVEDNTLRSAGGPVIAINKASRHNNVHATITGNEVLVPRTTSDLADYMVDFVFSSSTLAGPAGTMCVAMSGNTIPSSGRGEAAVRILKLSTTAGLTTSFQGFTGTTPAELASWLALANPGLGTVSVLPSTMPQFAFPNMTCQTP